MSKGQGGIAGEGGGMRRYGSWPAWLVLGVFFIAPLLALFPEAFADSGSAFGRVLANPLFWGAVRNTLLLGLTAGVVSTAVGVAVALELAKLPPNKRQWVMTLLGLPLAFSGLVIAFGFILAFGRAGFVTQLVAMLGADPATVGSWIYTVYGLSFAYAYYLIPRVALTLYPVFANLDKRPLEAARTLGASNLRGFWEVVVPEVAPSVLAAACLVSALAMGTYGTALALVGTQLNILPLMLYIQVSDGGVDFPAAAALSILLMVICAAVMATGDGLNRKRERHEFGANH